ncbi:MAG: hypothetical protein DRN00_02010 [Thermoplasmata archaeon]|nr:MAG: hypothetical protein DRN03_00945 [Thermoplasmata archaeon]RLF39393.1 MAG: hypothetical protein DRN00_02010 [Thermoplasmata archaeon]
MTTCAYLDEIGNDIVDKVRSKSFGYVFLRYFFGKRWLLKVGILYLALVQVFPLYPLVALILFDEAYLLMDYYSKARLKR